jgi:hypothetical protein
MKISFTSLLLLVALTVFAQNNPVTQQSVFSSYGKAVPEKIKKEADRQASAIDKASYTNIVGDSIPIIAVEDTIRITGYFVHRIYWSEDQMLKAEEKEHENHRIVYYKGKLIFKAINVNSSTNEQIVCYYSEEDNKLTTDEISSQQKLNPDLQHFYDLLLFGKSYLVFKNPKGKEGDIINGKNQ